MKTYHLSVVITTYNRPDLLKRAVLSVEEQQRAGFTIEIIIIDDASELPIPKFTNPNIVCYRMFKNGGPGPARMQGLALAHSPWVLILDDDDTLVKNIVLQLIPYLEDPTLSPYPVIQFSRSNSELVGQDRILNFDDYMQHKIKGDYTPIFNRAVFLKTKLRYPDNPVGGEHLLWWRLASDYGIPTFSLVLVNMHADAPTRMTHFSSQIKKAVAHKQLAETTLIEFGQQLKNKYPEQYQRICLARITYSMLSNECHLARSYIKISNVKNTIKWALWFISWLPQRLIKQLFLFYRRRH